MEGLWDEKDSSICSSTCQLESMIHYNGDIPAQSFQVNRNNNKKPEIVCIYGEYKTIIEKSITGEMISCSGESRGSQGCIMSKNRLSEIKIIKVQGDYLLY